MIEVEGKWMNITLRQLRKWGACEPQVELFKQLFGEEVELTEALVLEHGPKFDLNWIAEKIMTPERLEAYQKAIAPAEEAYEKATAAAFLDAVKE
jgi:hypothetical protein